MSLAQIGDVQGWQAMLAAAEKVTGAAGLQVIFSHGKAVRRAHLKPQALPCGLGGVVTHQNTKAFHCPGHPAAQVVQCRKAIALCVSITSRCVGHIHAYLINVVETNTSSWCALKASITPAFSAAFRRPCITPTLARGKRGAGNFLPRRPPRGPQVAVAFLYQWANNVHLPSGVYLFCKKPNMSRLFGR